MTFYEDGMRRPKTNPYYPEQLLFFKVCKYGDPTTVKNFLNIEYRIQRKWTSIDVNAIDPFWHPYYDEHEIVHKLRVDGVGFNETAWHMACFNENSGVLEELLKNDNMPKTNIDSISVFGQTPFQYACKYGHKRNVELLIKYNENIRMGHRDSKSRTAIHFAANNGHTEIVELLLEQNIEANPSDLAGFTPLHLACMNGHFEIVQIYCAKKTPNLSNINFNARDPHGRTPFHYAAIHGHLKMTKLLLDINEVEKNTVDNYGFTPFLTAKNRGHTEIVRLLTEHKSFQEIVKLSTEHKPFFKRNITRSRSYSRPKDHIHSRDHSK